MTNVEKYGDDAVRRGRGGDEKSIEGAAPPRAVASDSNSDGAQQVYRGRRQNSDTHTETRDPMGTGRDAGNGSGPRSGDRGGGDRGNEGILATLSDRQLQTFERLSTDGQRALLHTSYALNERLQVLQTFSEGQTNKLNSLRFELPLDFRHFSDDPSCT